MQTSYEKAIVELLESHRLIEKNVDYYLQLVIDLLHDTEVALDENHDMFYIVDYSVLFQRLFPLLAGRRNEEDCEEALQQRLRLSLVDQVLINFFFETCPKRVLLKIYAEAYQRFYVGRRYRAADVLRPESSKLLPFFVEELESYNRYYALWRLQLDDNLTKQQMQEMVQSYIAALDHGQVVLEREVFGRDKGKLFSLSEALEGEELDEVDTSYFRQLSSGFSNGKFLGSEESVKALSTVKALNSTFGEAKRKRQRGAKRFVFVTGDEDIWGLLKQLPDELSLHGFGHTGGSRISICRSYDHLLLLFICGQELWGGTPQDGDEEADNGSSEGKPTDESEVRRKLLLEKLIKRKEGLEDYLKWLGDARKVLDEIQVAAQNPDIVESVREARGSQDSNRVTDIPSLCKKLEDFRDSKEYQQITRLNKILLLADPVGGEYHSSVPQIRSYSDFASAINDIGPLTMNLDVADKNPFRHLQAVEERLDVMIAMLDTPIWNKYTRFNYRFGDIGGHPFEKELSQVAAHLEKRQPMMTAKALESLFKLRRDPPHDVPKERRFSFLNDDHYNALLSRAYRIQARYHKAIQICDRALMFWETDSSASGVIELLIEKGLSLKMLSISPSNKQHENRALECFRKAYEARPEDGRIVHELAVSIWRPVDKDLTEWRQAAKAKHKDELFSSLPQTVKIIDNHRVRIHEALKILSSWLDQIPPAKLTNPANVETTLFAPIANDTAYFSWITCLKSNEVLAASQAERQKMATACKDALSLSTEARRIVGVVDKERRAPGVEYRVLETVIQILLSLAEISALDSEIDPLLLEKLELELHDFDCSGELDKCYHNVHREYDKLRRLYVIPYIKDSSRAANDS